MLRGVLSPRTGSSARHRAYLGSHHLPSPSLPPTQAGIATATPATLLLLPLVPPCTSIHLPSPGFAGVLSPYIPSMPDITSTLPSPCPAGLGLQGLQSGVRRSHTPSWTPSPGCHQGLFSGPHTSIWIFIQDGSEHPALHGRVAPHAHPPKPFGPNTNQTPWNEPE